MTFRMVFETRIRFQDVCRYEPVSSSDIRLIKQCYLMLLENMEPGKVEDTHSFQVSMTLSSREGVFPTLIAALQRDQIRGVIFGVYLADLCSGFIMYACVAPSYRKRGIYTQLKMKLSESFEKSARQSGTEAMQFIISEVKYGTLLYRKYCEDWGAYVAPFDYQQPPVQGLYGKPLKLIILPAGIGVKKPTTLEALNVAGILYKKIYRLPKTDHDFYYSRLIQSMPEKL